MSGCQNYGPVLGTLNIRGRIRIGTQRGTIILTTTHIYVFIQVYSSIIYLYDTCDWIVVYPFHGALADNTKSCYEK